MLIIKGFREYMLNNKITFAKFQRYNIELFTPDFRSNLTDLIIELDYLRKKRLKGTTQQSQNMLKQYLNKAIKK